MGSATSTRIRAAWFGGAAFLAALLVAASAAHAEKVVLHTPDGDWEMHITPRGSYPPPTETHGIVIRSAPGVALEDDDAVPESDDEEAAEADEPAETQTETTGDGTDVVSVPEETHGIAITPYAPFECGPGEDCGPLAMATMYDRIYRSIPYRIAESRANPSYRHDATMEILTGQLRPAIVAAPEPAHFGPPAVAPVDVQWVNPNSRFGWSSPYGFYHNSRILGNVWWPYRGMYRGY